MDDVQRVIDNLRCIQKIHGFPKYGKKAVDAAISAMQELQRYRQTGTPEECREAMEKQQGGLLEFKWIPVEERLPERTIEMPDGVFGSEPVAVTTVNENGKLYRSCDFLIGEQWACAFKNEKVIAWQPLPAPYQPKEEQHGKMYSRKKGDC